MNSQKDRIMHSFPDYNIELDRRVDGRGKPYDVFSVTDRLGGSPIYSDRSYDNAYRFAVQLQERISVAKDPESYVKVPLITVGDLSIIRTVKSYRGQLRWTYIAVDKGRRIVLEATNYIDICMAAVNRECSKLDNCVHELRGPQR